MLCEVSFLQFEKFHKHIDTVFLRIDIKRLLLLVVRAQRNLVWKKIIIKMCHLKGLFRIQAFFFFSFTIIIIIQTFGCPVSKSRTNLSFVRMDYLLKYTPNDSSPCVRKVKITDSSPFSETERLYMITVNITM